jgi:hypothetical protein
MAKDMQKAKFWRSIREVNPTFGGFEKTKHIERWVERVRTYKSLQARYPCLTRLDFKVSDDYTEWYPKLHLGTAIVRLAFPKSKNQRWRTDVLWLMARAIKRKSPEFTTGTCHDWQMCSVYMDLVRYSLGKEAADKLKEAFKKNKVRWKKPLVRNSEPSEAQLRARRMFSVKRKLYAKPNSAALAA